MIWMSCLTGNVGSRGRRWVKATLREFVVDPLVRWLESRFERDRRLPAEQCFDPRVVAVPPSYALGRVELIDAPKLDACDPFDDIDELIDRDELAAADVLRPAACCCMPVPSCPRTPLTAS